MCSPLDYEEFASLTDGKQVKKVLADHGLGCISAHFGMKELRKRQSESLAWAHDVGITQMITATLGAGNTPTLDDVKRAADEYNKIAAVTAKAGMQQGLHNEGFELSEVGGRRTYDILFELLDPALVKFQFQMSTISRGFVAHEYFTKYPGRFFSMHVQDVDMKATPAGADLRRQGQHRLGEDVPGGEGRRREELLRRAEHGADEAERGVPEDLDSLNDCLEGGAMRGSSLAFGCWPTISLVVAAALREARSRRWRRNPCRNRRRPPAVPSRRHRSRAARPSTRQSCAPCHGATLGGGTAPPLTGPSFELRWDHPQLTLDDLFYVVRTTMPPKAASSVRPADHAAVFAYLLQANGYHAGTTPVSTTARQPCARRRAG